MRMGKSKEFTADKRKRTVDLHRSGMSLGDIFKQLPSPRSSVSGSVHKNKSFDGEKHLQGLEENSNCLTPLGKLWFGWSGNSKELPKHKLAVNGKLLEHQSHCLLSSDFYITMNLKVPPFEPLP